MRTLKKRREFVSAARGKRAGRANIGLQAIAVAEAEPGVGFTVTKKVGNSPERNRVKRRLRAAARACAERFEPRHDYVILGRREALQAPFSTLVGELRQLLTRIHSSSGETRRTAETAKR